MRAAIVGAPGLLALLAACSSIAPYSSTVPAPRPNNHFFTHLVFVSDSQHGVIRIYDEETQQLRRTLGGLTKPQALLMGPENVLYVIQGGVSSIRVYDLDYKYGLLHDSGNLPQGIAWDPAGERVGVTNACTIAQSCPPHSGSIQYYEGDKWICHIPVPDYQRVGFIAFDYEGNLYFNGIVGSGAGHVVISEVQRGTECDIPTKYFELPTGNVISSVGNLSAHFNGLSVLDPKAKTIYTYALPKNRTLGNPIATTRLDGVSGIPPAGFVLLSSGTAAFILDDAAKTANRFLMPQGGNPKKSIAIGGFPSGVALTAVPSQ
jgi:hypothetical protein